MNYTFDEYQYDFNTVRQKYISLAVKPGSEWLRDNLDVKRGYDVYKKTLENTLGFLVIGRTNVDKMPNKRVLGPAIENDMLSNFGAINDGNSIDPRIKGGSSNYLPNTEKLQTSGGILHYPEKNSAAGITDSGPWHFLINDSFILAGVHKRLEFHLASPRITSNLVGPYGITVTFRELIGLRAFGYKFRSSPNFTSPSGETTQLNEIAQCYDFGAAQKASLQAYWEAIAMYENRYNEFTSPSPFIDMN
jgi:hypothetical protein